jgi:hypothetical protein
MSFKNEDYVGYDISILNNGPTLVNPLPVQFKTLMPGQEGCVFFGGHLNVRKYHYILVHLCWQAAF